MLSRKAVSNFSLEHQEAFRSGCRETMYGDAVRSPNPATSAQLAVLQSGLLTSDRRVQKVLTDQLLLVCRALTVVVREADDKLRGGAGSNDAKALHHTLIVETFVIRRALAALLILFPTLNAGSQRNVAKWVRIYPISRPIDPVLIGVPPDKSRFLVIGSMDDDMILKIAYQLQSSMAVIDPSSTEDQLIDLVKTREREILDSTTLSDTFNILFKYLRQKARNRIASLLRRIKKS